jgi:DNA primase
MLPTTHIDLVALIERTATIRLVRVATSAGGEYHGPCPWCGGQDRFFVQPEHPTRPHYQCRQCGRNGDAIAFLREYCGMSFIEACQELDIEPGGYSAFARSPVRNPDDAPCKEWQARAKEFIHVAQQLLWSHKGKEALDYLYGRGLNNKTIEYAQLGYCPVWYKDTLEAWGLTSEDTQKDMLRIPDGIIIPWRYGDQVWKFAVKRPFAKKDELNYGQVVGSKEGLYNADMVHAGRPVVMVEGEFDALAIIQACPGFPVVATGSVSRARTPRWLSHLSRVSQVLISFDADEAGDEGSHYWLDQLDTAMRWRPWAKDPNEMLQYGQDIRNWLSMGLDIAVQQPPPAPCKAEAQVIKLSETCSICGAETEWFDDNAIAYCDDHYPYHHLRTDGAPHWPRRLDAYDACTACGGREWGWYETKKRWVCACYWYPERRSFSPEVVVEPSLPAPKTWDDLKQYIYAF